MEPRLNRCFIGPTHIYIPNMASRLVQPFSHSWWQTVPILYNGPPLPPSKLPFAWGIWTPI